MLNLHELEQRWLHYKIKSYLPYFAIFTSVVLILSTLSIFFLNSQKSELQEPLIKVKTTLKSISTIEAKLPTKSVNHIAVQELADKRVQDEEKITLSPSLGFMKKMQTELQPYYMKEKSTSYRQPSTKAKPQKHTQRHFQKKIKLPEENKVVISEIAVEEKDKQLTNIKHISIKRESTYKDIAEIINRFKKNNNPALSLFVAKKYYELGHYRQARNYALITNNLNQNIEASWLIFSKSLVKLGKKDKAIKTLQKYIDYNHSNSAEILLNEIRSGKFI